MNSKLTLALALVFASITPKLSEGGNLSFGPVVHLTSGRVVGTYEENIAKYLGIPYAKAPIGERRFAPPEAIGDIGQDFAANREVTCPQVTGNQTVGTEDCLVVNVYTPRHHSHQPLDVFVFIHGGSFTGGSGVLSIYNSSEFVRNNSILVTLNYRLGSLGFLALPQPIEGADNLGIQDQTLALQWVQNNISRFGGNPNNITLFGHSAGGSGVLAQLVNPNSRSLFHRAIIMSAPFNSVYSREEAVAVAKNVIDGVECTDSSNTLDCLRGKTTAELVEAGADAANGLIGFSAWMDGGVIDRQPITAFTEGAAANIPLYIGSTVDEATVFTPGLPIQVTDETTFGLVVGSVIAPAAIEPLGQIYFPAFQDWSKAFDALFAELTFACPARAQLEAASKHGLAYGYRFARTQSSGPNTRLGAFHGLELRYVFDSFDFDEGYTPTPSDRQLHKSVNTSFRYFGLISAGQNRTLNIPQARQSELQLAPYSSQSPQYVVFDEQISTSTEDKMVARCQALEQLGLVQVQ